MAGKLCFFSNSGSSIKNKYSRNSTNAFIGYVNISIVTIRDHK
ncbi:hypothetical protein [Clostridium sp. JS66]|nr:hypothetical protein [Clostridium sp. JS66]WPC39839.1 hypothetical protein Q6H37_18190 [Clostridium sp. JS66]